MTWSDPKCGRKWTGLIQAHCSVCHRQFSTVANFDAHRVNKRGCPDPASLRRKKRDGTEVPILKEVSTVHGPLWVSWSEDPRHEESATDADGALVLL